MWDIIFALGQVLCIFGLICEAVLCFVHGESGRLSAVRRPQLVKSPLTGHGERGTARLLPQRSAPLGPPDAGTVQERAREAPRFG